MWVIVEQSKPVLWTDKEVGIETEKVLGRLIETTLAYKFKENNEPKILELDPEAKRIYTEWYNQIAIENRKDLDREEQDGYDRKLQAQCLRIILILHCMEAVADGSSEENPIIKNTVKKSIRLCEYLKKNKDMVIKLILENRVQKLHPLVRRAAKAICDLEFEIVKGRISTSRITEYINDGLDDKHHVTSEDIGRAAVKLGLTKKRMRDGKSRGIEISQKDIKRLKHIFKIPSNPSEVSEKM